MGCYRPQSALDHFMTWKDTEDDKMKSIFYPKYSKSYLFENNFIIEKSAHTRGSTVDLTLVDEKTGKELIWDLTLIILAIFRVHYTQKD